MYPSDTHTRCVGGLTMARLKLILQAATDTTHAEAIGAPLKGAAAESVLISVAFVREAGVEAVEGALKPVAAKTNFFVGIRNGVTSIQGIKRLLALKVQLYVVDTGSRDTIFHPKLYLIVEKQKARIIIGSANLTFQGLYNNIEASTLVSLDLADEADRGFVEQTTKAVNDLLRTHPQHVFAVKNDKDADALSQSGRLVDETIIPAPSAASAAGKDARDTLPRMKLKRAVRPRLRVARKGVAAVTTAAIIAPTPVLPIRDYYLVWESKELTERDLNVPTGATTHRTGSMLLKKGAIDNIDQRHFFRDQVFNALTWTRDARKSHLERAVAMFELVIKNLNYGKFRLRLTHNTKTTSRTYRQKNAMSQLHWGDALPVVTRRDLLGRIMYLYRKDTGPPEFLIEID